MKRKPCRRDRRARSACIAGGLIEASSAVPSPARYQERSACIAGGLIEARSTATRFRRSFCRVPPVLQAASLKQRNQKHLVAFARSVPPVLKAASLKQAGLRASGSSAGVRSACIAGGLIEASTVAASGSPCGSVPPVLQAASLKRHDALLHLARAVQRSACIAGGLIEANEPIYGVSRCRLRSACIAGGLIEAVPCERRLDRFQSAFRLYCRRPH